MVRQWWEPTEKGSLSLHDVDGSKFSALACMDRERLETIRDFHIVLYFPAERPTKETWRTLFQKTPNLENLQIVSRTIFEAFLARLNVEGGWENQVLSDVFSVLLEHDGFAFRDKLKRLYIGFACKNYDNVGDEIQHSYLSKSLFLEVLPLFPNLRRLLMKESFLAADHIVEIANAIVEQEKQQAPGKTKSNTNLVSIGVSALGSLLVDPTSHRGQPKLTQPMLVVQKAFLTILQSNAFPGLYRIDERLLAKGDTTVGKGNVLTCELEGQLLLNHSCRYRFDLDPFLSKKLWPRILYRAYKGSDRVFAVVLLHRAKLLNATGLYELLRNCPQILQHLVEDCSLENQKQKNPIAECQSI